ncbi:hypothetical protein [Christiangramia aquimixticola]|uniref:hypothetical protein n=1 Tax=Christiangramia aquimixticola TaxID=1697558 RepID=UPI003AA9AE8A
MKRLVAILMTFVLTGCSLDSDTPNTYYELAEITDNDLPEEFVYGKTYEINVNYLLPTECNVFQAIDARREGNMPAERRIIYVSIITSVVESNSCDRDFPGGAGAAKFNLTIDEREAYTFNFWTGASGTEPVYNEVIIPVVEEATSTD